MDTVRRFVEFGSGGTIRIEPNKPTEITHDLGALRVEAETSQVPGSCFECIRQRATVQRHDMAPKQHIWEDVWHAARIKSPDRCRKFQLLRTVNARGITCWKGPQEVRFNLLSPLCYAARNFIRHKRSNIPIPKRWEAVLYSW